jgi:hypothetical protein
MPGADRGSDARLLSVPTSNRCTDRGRESAWLAQEPQGPKWQSSYLRAQYEAGERLRADYWFAHMPRGWLIYCKSLHSASAT